MFKNCLLIGFGGALGSIARYAISLLTKKYWKMSFPLGTFMTNMIGCFLIGLLIAYLQKNSNDALKLLFITGFCGGFTTFSSFSGENIELIQNNQIGISLLYIMGSIAIGLVATWLGILFIKG
ncbi:MAG: fluoride efflux transporter CrcB [Phycisphaerales bacterium]|nr:fluoride efflux transporter CrcB [Phycisphaerales bacterium]